MTNAVEKFNTRVEIINSLLCVGLDSDIRLIPDRFLTSTTPQFDFNRWIIEQTQEFTSAYKPQIAFYEARGDAGLRELKLTMEYLTAVHPDILTICDAKRGDIGSTSEGYATAIFDWLGFDAVTLNPYLGREALDPFLKRQDKGCIILCRTSNPGAGEFQDLQVNEEALWEIIAWTVNDSWNTHENCMLVAGATYPEELRRIREIVGEMTLLVPGLGAQGGDVEATVRAGINTSSRGMILNSARGIIFSSDPSLAARDLRDSINQYRQLPDQ